MESEGRKAALITFDKEILDALDKEARSEKRSRAGQLEIILRDRYAMPMQVEQNGRASKKRKAA